MDLQKLVNSSTPFKFWRTDGTAMDVNILLLCKLLFLVLITNYFFNYIDGPYLPFIEGLDVLRPYSSEVKLSLQSLFLISGVLLLCNIRVRVMALLLGLIVLFALVCSKPLFRNHLFICACGFLLAALTKKGQSPWLLIAQLSLIYLGALLNKVTQVDWWNGQFMHNWLGNARENQMYLQAAEWLPGLWMAKLISWSSMLVECSIGVLLLVKRKQYLAIWLILFFHTLLYTVTLFRFGHFFEDIVVFLLVFLAIPKTEIKVCYQVKKIKILAKFLKFLNFNQNMLFSQEITNDKWLTIEFEDHIYSNFQALRYVLLYSTGFYISLFLLDLAVRWLTDGDLWHVIMVTLSWILIVFYLPIFKRKTVGWLGQEIVKAP